MIKKLLFTFHLILTFSITQGYSQWQADTSFEGTSGSSERFGRSVSISNDGTVMAVGAYRDGEPYDNNGSLDQRGTVRIYGKDASDTWVQTATITNTEIGANFGRSLSLNADGTTLAIGAPNAGNGQIVTSTFGTFSFQDIVTNNTGLVKVYTNNGSNNWAQIGADITGEQEGEFFGWSVSISDDGKTFAAGGYGANNQKGIARIYENNTNSWVKSDEFNGTDEGERTGFSISLSANGNTVAVGADKHDAEKGATTVYSKNESNTWAQVGATIDGENEGENSGFSLSISDDGNTLIIGAYNYNNSQGTARIYNNENDAWVKTGQIDGEADTQDEFGSFIAITPDAKTIAIGAKSYDFSNGVTRVYTLNDTNNWTQKGSDILSGAPAFSFVFSSTAISLSADGNTIAIGAYSYNSTGGFTNDGKVQIYTFNDASLSTDNFITDKIDFRIENQKIAVSNENISVVIYNLLGKQTPNYNLNGVYIVRFINTTNGQTATKKVFIH